MNGFFVERGYQGFFRRRPEGSVEKIGKRYPLIPVPPPPKFLGRYAPALPVNIADTSEQLAQGVPLAERVALFSGLHLQK